MSDFDNVLASLMQACGQPIHEGNTTVWAFTPVPVTTYTWTVPLLSAKDERCILDALMRACAFATRKGRPVYRAHTRAHWGQHG